MRKRILLVSLAFTGILNGTAIYLFFREPTFIGDRLRALLPFWRFPVFAAADFVKFFLPDFLWGFSLCCALLAVFPNGKRTWLCFAITACFGALWELAQTAHIVSGTGDFWDVFAYGTAALFAVCINLSIKGENV